MGLDGVIAQMDPGAGYRARKAEIDAAVARVLASGWYILGREVAAFEREFAEYLGLRHAVGVANGTDAICLALRALAIGPGQRVATVAHTAVATVAAIEAAGAEPVLVDIDPATDMMDPAELERCLQEIPDIAAVIPVHLYGHPADMPSIMRIARTYGIAVIEDCAQAHGARLEGQIVGSFGDLACFSFYPTKNLGALGDAGAVATNHADLNARLRQLREYGWKQRYVSEEPGLNSRLDEIQAAILRARLPYLPEENQRRCEIALAYRSGLAGLPLELPALRPGTGPVWHQYVVKSDHRDALKAALTERGVGTNIHYPVPVHQQPAYAGRVKAGPSGLRHTEAAAARVLSLPIYPQLSDAAIETVITRIWQVLRTA